MNYEQELILLIQTNTIYTRPSQSVIDVNERVAQAVWNSFDYSRSSYEDWDQQTWYKRGNWGDVLNVYKHNIPFWEVLIDPTLEKNIYRPTILLLEEFQKDFPAVIEHYMGSNEKLLNLFEKTGNKEFFEKLDLSEEEKKQLHKEYTLKNYFSVDSEFIKNYQHETGLMLDLIKKEGRNYTYLNNENKNNATLIEEVLNNFDSYKWLPENRKEENFEAWLLKHAKEIKVKNLKDFNLEQQKKIIQINPELLRHMEFKEIRPYQEIIYRAMKIDFENMLDIMDKAKLSILYNSAEKINDIKPYLEVFIDNYSRVGKMDNKETKLMLLVSLDHKLTEKLENNIFYQVSDKTAKKEKISSDEFENYFKKTLTLYETRRYDIGQMEMLMQQIKRLLDIEVMKELRLPGKDLFQTLRIERLHDTIQQTLPEKAVTKRKKL